MIVLEIFWEPPNKWGLLLIKDAICLDHDLFIRFYLIE